MRLLIYLLLGVSCLHLAMAVPPQDISGRAPNAWRGVRIYFSYNTAGQKPESIIHIIGGMRIKHPELIKWLEVLSSGDRGGETSIGFQVAYSFYTHLLFYLDFNGFDIRDLFYVAHYGGLDDNPEYRGVVGMYISPDENFPLAWFPALLDAVKSYFTDPVRSPAYPVTVVRVPDAFHHDPDPMKAEFHWSEDLFKRPPGAAWPGQAPAPQPPWANPPPGTPRRRPPPQNYLTIWGSKSKRGDTECDEPKDLRDEVDHDNAEYVKMKHVPLLCKG